MPKIENPKRGRDLQSRQIPLSPSEGVKKLVSVVWPSFRRKPESNKFNLLATSWTPGFTRRLKNNFFTASLFQRGKN
jgi:hypothetical protein